MISRIIPAMVPKKRRRRPGPDMARVERVEDEQRRLLAEAQRKVAELRKEAGLD